MEWKKVFLLSGNFLKFSDDVSQKLRHSLHRNDLVTHFIWLSQHLQLNKEQQLPSPPQQSFVCIWTLIHSFQTVQ